MSTIQLNIDVSELEKLISACMPTPQDIPLLASSTTTDDLGDAIIDRNFIKCNAGCSSRIILRYERNGILRRVENPKDSKGVYYKLSDYLKMCDDANFKPCRKNGTTI